MPQAADDPHGLDELARRRAHGLTMGGPEKLAAQHEKGRLNARERIAAVLDPGSFREIGQINHSDLPATQDKTPADGKIAGFGAIEGRTVYVTADDITVLAGSGGRVGVSKVYKTTHYAIEKGYPLVMMGEGGGTRMPDNLGAANHMRTPTLLRGETRDRRVPFVNCIMGESYGSPTWKTALADVSIQVKGTCMAVSGPRVIEQATGERLTPEELGGWEIHAKQTGLIDLVAENDSHCLQLVRKVLSYLPSNHQQLPPVADTGDDPGRRLDDILDVMPASLRRAYDMHKMLDRIFDHGSVLELKPLFDPSLIIAFARLAGRTIGVFASNPMHFAGAQGPGACEKATAFVCLCDSFNIPMIMLQDTPGFFVGRAAELRKMPLKIMTLSTALQRRSVPLISVVLRRSYGLAHRTMGGAGAHADVLLAWPGADISFMAAENAVGVVYARELKKADNPEEMRARYLEKVQQMNAPWEAAGLGLIDDIIDPRDTRKDLAQHLALACGPDGDGQRSQRLLAGWPQMF
jgi:acetyl-CoA carboxylase carboxyltransferase component